MRRRRVPEAVLAVQGLSQLMGCWSWPLPAYPITPGGAPTCSLRRLMHPVYSKEYVESVVPSHKPPKQVGTACCKAHS